MSNGQVDYSDDDELRETLQLLRETPLVGLSESEFEWHLDTFSISKVRPTYRIGWSFALQPESRFYKRWFDFPDLRKKGWAIIFRVWDSSENHTSPGINEKFPGWVPPEREAEADEWIEFLNAEIRDRLRQAGGDPVTSAPKG